MTPHYYFCIMENSNGFSQKCNLSFKYYIISLVHDGSVAVIHKGIYKKYFYVVIVFFRLPIPLRWNLAHCVKTVFTQITQKAFGDKICQNETLKSNPSNPFSNCVFATK